MGRAKLSLTGKYARIIAAFVTGGASGLSLALASTEAKATEAENPAVAPMPVASQLQAIREAVSTVAATELAADGMHGSLPEGDIKLAWWGNGNGRGWGNGGRGWGNGRGPMWGNGGWHNWHNGGRYWYNY